MLNPFDSEFVSQELREAWKKIEELEKENKELLEELECYKEIEMLDEERRWYDDNYDEGSD